MNRNALITTAAMVTLSGMLIIGCTGEDELATSKAADQPIVYTGFDPVVRIKSSLGTYCTATAIDSDLLITSASCVKPAGHSISDYVQVVATSGGNSSAVGRYSSYYIMSQDLYSNSYSGVTLTKRDFALIKFGAETFSYFYDTATGSSSTVGTTARVVSYGTGAAATFDRTIDQYYSWTNSPTTNGFFQMNAAGAGNSLNSNDGGAAVLVGDSTNGYQLIAVMSSIDSQYGYASALTDSVIQTLWGLFNNVSSVCSEIYKDINYKSTPFSFCNTDNEGGINGILASLSTSDPFKMFKAWKYTDWNDAASSLKLPSNTILTMYQNLSGDGSTITFQNAFPFGDVTNVSSLVDYSFNDKVSAFSAITTSAPSNYSFLIQTTVTGKCLDVSGGNSANGTSLLEWDCTKNNTNQLFRIEAVGNYYQIRHPATDNCLDVTGGGGDGTPMQLWHCVTNANQLFTITPNTTSNDVRDFTIKNKGTGKCLDMTDGNSTNGTVFTTWTCNSTNPNQNFALKLF